MPEYNNGASPEEILQKARIHQNAGRWDEAANLCRCVLQSRPGDVKAMLLLSKSMSEMGGQDLAADLLLSVLHTARMGVGPVHFRALFDYGLIQIRQGNFRKLLIFYFMIAGKALKPVIRRILGPIRG